MSQKQRTYVLAPSPETQFQEVNQLHFSHVLVRLAAYSDP